MTIDRDALDKLLETMHIGFVSDEQYDMILNRFGTEPDGMHEWTEQDISEHIRKILR
ncbi:MAG: hypothetical protein ACI4HL_04735 [Ruminococcus sp.]